MESNRRKTDKTIKHSFLIRPPKRTCRQKVAYFCCDKENGTCLTRTPVNWFAITIYYFFFLLGVFIIFYIAIKIAIALGSDSKPYYCLGDSPIGSSPSINFFPFLKSRNLIWLSEKASAKKYIDAIEEEFDKYVEMDGEFEQSKFKECGERPFGYGKGSACIYLRLNRVLDWKPKPYKQKDKLPKDAPEMVKDLVKNTDVPKIWVTCNGTTAKDRDHLTVESFQYQGESGFNASVYPYTGQSEFLDPIVAVKVVDKNPNKILYSFTCTAWAKNLDRDKSKVDVSIYFE